MKYASYQKSPANYDVCPGCQGQKVKGSALCRSCRTAAATKAWSSCVDCGTRIKGAYTRCRECYERQREAVRPLCVDCGKPTKRYAAEYAAQRCWDCEVKRRRAKPLRKCSVEGCDLPHLAKGYCRNHYRQLCIAPRRQSYGTGHRGNQIAGWLSDSPCQLCGYDRMRSELHRLEPAAGYRPGNMVAVCSRCHDEIERGLTATPVPLSEEAIIALHLRP